MATTTKKLPPAEKREFQKEMSALKKAGLLPANVDVRKIQPTKHYRSLARKFEGVISGRDISVKVPKGARFGSSKVTRKGERAVVPRPQLNGKVRFDKKSGELIVTANVRGARIKSFYRDYDREQLIALQGKGVEFTVYVPRGGRYEVFRRFSIDELDVAVGERSSFQNFSNWMEFVNVEYTTLDETAEFDAPPAHYEPRVPTKAPKAKRRKRALTNKTGRNK